MEMKNSKPAESHRALNPLVENWDRLDSWKHIANYLNRAVRTVQRWETFEAMPVHRQLHEKSGSVYAFKPEIHAWQKSRTYRKQFDGRQSLLASSRVIRHALDEKEQLALRKLLEAILVQLTAQTTDRPGPSFPRSAAKAEENEIVSGQEDLLRRGGNVHGNSVRSHTFLPRMQ